MGYVLKKGHQGLSRPLMEELREDDVHAPLEDDLGFSVKNFKSLLLKITEPGLLISGVI